ncbi:unnamed protein product [Nyctereutes procyonoides]|uniref:(raccoon dog) hypothetical protein n=1 Tax=Nyctereutes procyonoides TaxID=34880 RepID=A0A811ZCH5_NYCPR|nr:unnamed protein product [Nyctereutes procyonoides]
METESLEFKTTDVLSTGMHRGLLVRPTNSKAKGATGSFKLVPKHKRKVQPRKTSTMTAPRRPSEGQEKVSKKPKEAKKDPPNPDKVKRGPRKPGEARTTPPKPGGKTHRKTKAGSRNSKSTIPKGENGAASPAKKENHVPKEVVAHAAKEGPKAKAAAPPNSGRSKTLPEHLARKTEAPRGPRRAGMPTKASSSKLASRKAKTES